jgi:hypothetical protein
VKRSPPPARRTPLARGTTPIPRESARRKRETGTRAKVKRTALDRDGGCSVAIDIPEIACAGPLDADEILSRGRGGSHLDDANVRIACRAHHDWLTRESVEAAHRGLRPYPAGYMGPRRES